jgi:hypothetical protein|tara:strand:+ start:4887 stop:5339 length:453 start_codon:yes stop_codon:yes gene_type:complete
MYINSLIFFIGSLLFFSVSSIAHHNPAAHYLVDERIEINGTVTEFIAANPHSRIYLDVINEEGVAERWMSEGDSIINLRRAGWTDDQFKFGDRIQILGRPSRFGRNLIEWIFITNAEGIEVGGGNGQFAERTRYIQIKLDEYRQQRDLNQ